MAVGSNLAGVARVSFQAETGQFNRDISEAEARYRATTGAMSDDALRMAVAQDRLQRTLARFGPESRQAAQATLQLRAAQRQAASETQHLSGSLGGVNRRAREAGGGLRLLGRDAEHAAYGVTLGTRAIHGLRSAVFFSASGLAGFGLTSVLRSARDAALEQQVQLGQLQAALKAAGIAQSAYTGVVREGIDAQQKLGFSEDSSVRSFSLAVRATRSIEGAQRLQAIAADVARGRNMDLVAATQLLVRVQAGQVGSLRRLGIEVQKGISGAKALDAVQRQYAGSAAAYADSAAGAQARFNIALHQTEATIGTALLPVITNLNGRLAAWLDNSKNQERIQRDVNEAVRDGTAVVRGLGSAFRVVDQITGSFHNTLELLSAAFVGLRLAKWARELGLLKTATKEAGAAAAITAGEENALAAAETRVGESAVVSRIAAYTGAVETMGATAVTSTGEIAGLRGALAGLSAINPIVIPITLAFVADRSGLNTLAPDLVNDILGKNRNLGDILIGSPGHRGVVGGFLHRHFGIGSNAPRNERQPAPQNQYLIPHYPTAHHPHNRRRRRTSLEGRLNLNQLALSQDALTASTDDDVRDLRARAALLRQQIARETNLAKKTDETNELRSVLDQLQQIADQKEQAASDASAKAARATAARREKRLKAARERERALNAKIKRLYNEDIAARRSNVNGALHDRSEYLNKLYGLGKSASAAAKRQSTAAKTDIAALIREERDIRAGFFGQYASNLLPPGHYGGTASASASAGKTVIMNQHFTASPEDPHRYARMTRIAAQAVFD